MSKNMGTVDRAIRTALGLGIFVLIMMGAISGTAGVILSIIAAILILTSAIAFCPIYAILNISTRRKHALPQNERTS